MSELGKKNISGIKPGGPVEDGVGFDDIRSLVELFNGSDWDELRLELHGVNIVLSSDPHADAHQSARADVTRARGAERTELPPETLSVPAEAPAKASGEGGGSAEEGLVAIRAPNLGTFYSRPKPDAPAYVEAGQRIEEDTEVCLIEVMKLFAPVRAGVSGTVREVCAKDGDMVEYEQVLFWIEPEA